MTAFDPWSLDNYTALHKNCSSPSLRFAIEVFIEVRAFAANAFGKKRSVVSTTESVFIGPDPYPFSKGIMLLLQRKDWIAFYLS